MRLNPFLKLLACCTLIVTCQGYANSQSYAEQQKLLPEDGKAEDQFGFSVAIDGTTALVGALKADTKNIQDAGAAYVYSLGTTGWEQQAKLVAEPAHADDTLGGNVALKNHMAMLGVSRRDDKGDDAGAVRGVKEIERCTYDGRHYSSPVNIVKARLLLLEVAKAAPAKSPIAAKEP